MTERFLLSVFDSVYLLSMAAWIGGAAFLTFGATPLIFKTLEPAAASRLVRAIFPRYYVWSAVLASAALASFVAVPLAFPQLRGPRVGVQALLLLAGLLTSLYSGNSLGPAINRARNAGEPGQARFRKLHRRSVVLNMAVLVVGTGLLIAFACRPVPRAEGTIGPTPAEEARLEAEAIRSQSAAREGRPAPRAADADADAVTGPTKMPRPAANARPKPQP